MVDLNFPFKPFNTSRRGSRAAATSKMERFVIIVKDWKPLTIITKRSILDAAAVLDPPLTRKVRSLGMAFVAVATNINFSDLKLN